MNNAPRQISDQIVLAQDARLVMQRLNGDGWKQAMRELERLEPALAAYITTAADTIGMALHRVGYSNDQLGETQQFLLHALLGVHVLTRSAHRRLLNDFLPSDDGLVRRADGEGKPT
jgi:hypothetical protein